MYLKRLELKGFKTFAESTEIVFQPGINIIVGPNGCGKSNIVDAIRWVLGESNVRNLRGQKNEDVIFTGTDNKRPLGLAQVDVVIDNEDRGLPTEFTEVTVTRKVFRSGESEFFVNKVPVRLKDIHALFAGSGLGKKGYSIIGQGELDQVLNARAFERRLILEEASGLIKYRQRMEEAKARLALTEQDLLRVSDILQELGERQAELAAKAKKAACYRELKGELDELEKTLLAAEIAALGNEAQVRGGELAALREERDQYAEEIARYEEELALRDSEVERLRQELALGKEQKYRTVSEIEQLNGEIKLAEERIRNATDRSESLARDEVKYQQMIDKLLEDIHFAQENLGQEEERWQAKKGELHNLEEEVAGLDNKLAESEHCYEEAKTDLIDKLQQETRLKNELNGNHQRLERLGDKVKRCQVELQDKRLALTRLNESATQIETRLAGVALQLTDLRNTRDQLGEKHDKVMALLNQQEQLRQQLQAEIMKVEHQLNLYEQMEKEHAGYSEGVRSIIRVAGENPALLPGILGVVGDIIEVPPGLETALETALGRGIENVVVKRENDARRAIQFLKKNSRGRVTFLPLDLLRVPPLNQPKPTEITRFPGVIGWAWQLVSYPTGFEKVIKYLLGRVIVVENLEAGVKFFQNNLLPVRLVTLEGEILNSSGAMTGGKGGGRSLEPLKRKNLIKKQIALKEQKNCAYEELNKEIEKLGGEGRQLEEEIKQESGEIEKHGLQEKMLRLELEQSHQEGAKLKEAIAGLANEKSQYVREIESLQKAIRALDLQHRGVVSITEELSTRVDNLRKEREQGLRQYEVLKERSSSLQEYVMVKERELANLRKNYHQFNHVQESYLGALRECREQENRLKKEGEREKARREELISRCREKQVQLQEIEKALHTKNEMIGQVQAAVKEINCLLAPSRALFGEREAKLRMLELKLARLEADIENHTTAWKQNYGELAREQGPVLKEKDLRAMRGRIEILRPQLGELGLVDPGAEQEYEEVTERYRFLNGQYQDITRARDALFSLLEETRLALSAQFDDFLQLANHSFNQTFMEVFGGGSARLVWDGEINRLESGVDIVVKMPGKRKQLLDLLSGGERALTCIAFIFALLRLKPVPFCMLDEIDASLDDVNLTRFAAFLKKLAGRIQFILVTHRQGTIESGEAIYGVTMAEEGISHVLSVTLQEAEELAG